PAEIRAHARAASARRRTRCARWILCDDELIPGTQHDEIGSRLCHVSIRAFTRSGETSCPRLVQVVLLTDYGPPDSAWGVRKSPDRCSLQSTAALPGTPDRCRQAAVR